MIPLIFMHVSFFPRHNVSDLVSSSKQLRLWHWIPSNIQRTNFSTTTTEIQWICFRLRLSCSVFSCVINKRKFTVDYMAFYDCSLFLITYRVGQIKVAYRNSLQFSPQTLEFQCKILHTYLDIIYKHTIISSI